MCHPGIHTSFKSKIGRGPFAREAGILPKTPSSGSLGGSVALASAAVVVVVALVFFSESVFIGGRFFCGVAT